MARVNDPPTVEIQIAELCFDGFEGADINDITKGLQYGVERAIADLPFAHGLVEHDNVATIDAGQIDVAVSAPGHSIGAHAGSAAVRAILGGGPS